MADKGRKLDFDGALRIKKRCALARKMKAEAKLLSDKALGQKFEIPACTVRNFGSGRACKEIPDEDKRLLQDCIDERTRLLAEAKKHRAVDIAADEGVCSSVVSHIANGLLWKTLPDLDEL